MRKLVIFSLGSALLLSACAQQEEPPVVLAEPVYDKYGNLVVEQTAPASGAVMVDTNGDGVPDTPVVPDPEPEPEPVDDDPNRNRNQNQNTNQNRVTGG